MINSTIRRVLLVTFCSAAFFISNAQPGNDSGKETKPYRILTSGKQVTVRSTKNIKNIMVWAASGHRIIEQRDINAPFYSFNVNVNEKIVFVMIQYEGSKPFTEKIGVQP